LRAGIDPWPQLDVLLDLYARGLREPLPLPCLAAAAYANKGASAAKQAWESGFKFDKEDKELEHQLVFGRVLTFDELLRFVPLEDECWSADPSRFGQLARRLWGGLLDHEQLT
jgi:exodeoxyribonuclease V gamma subunit